MPIETTYALSGTANEYTSTQSATADGQGFATVFQEEMTAENAADSSQNASSSALPTATTQGNLVAEAGEMADVGAEEEESAHAAKGESLVAGKADEELDASAKSNVDDTTENLAEKDAKTLEKPCIAQFMVMTGCDFKTASAALYQYENWQDYLTKDATLPDLSSAQMQLQAERDNGSRLMVNGTYGARLDYTKPTPVEPEVPGSVVPVFNEETGSISGLGFITAEGEQKTTAGLTDRETIVAHAEGFHIGHAALDQFAKLATEDESARFDTLDLSSLSSSFPSMQEWITKNGRNAAWNTFEPTQAHTEDVAEDTTQNFSLTETALETMYSPLYAEAEMSSLLMAAL